MITFIALLLLLIVGYLVYTDVMYITETVKRHADRLDAHDEQFGYLNSQVQNRLAILAEHQDALDLLKSRMEYTITEMRKGEKALNLLKRQMKSALDLLEAKTKKK
jgi:hypothetical protein